MQIHSGIDYQFKISSLHTTLFMIAQSFNVLESDNPVKYSLRLELGLLSTRALVLFIKTTLACRHVPIIKANKSPSAVLGWSVLWACFKLCDRDSIILLKYSPTSSWCIPSWLTIYRSLTPYQWRKDDYVTSVIYPVNNSFNICFHLRSFYPTYLPVHKVTLMLTLPTFDLFSSFSSLLS